MLSRLPALAAWVIWLVTVSPAQAIDPSIFVGTIDVKFQPMQSAGVREGCSLVYNVVGQDHAYRQGKLISLIGNITFATKKDRSNVGLALKVVTINAFDKKAKPESPFFAYLQTSHGTTARSKSFQYDSPDTPGARIFLYRLDEDVMKVLEDITSGAPVTIGFNRRKGGMDVLVSLDLSVAETTATDSGFNHRHSDEMVEQFALCNGELAKQASAQLEAK